MSASNLQSINSPESRKAGDPLELTIYGVGAVFRYCPPGKFLMGSPENEKGRHISEVQRKVTLTRGFWLLETPVTQALWMAVTGMNPSRFRGADARPVESVSWNDCNKFIRKLNDAKVAPDGMKVDFPTEAEWEYACRAGTTTRYNCGDDLTESDANFGRIFRGTTPVKSFAPNAWGVYDMHGNVWEWCSDWNGFYSPEPTTDPQGVKTGLERVLRGGCWNCDAKELRSACLNHENPSFTNSLSGFWIPDICKFCGVRLALRSLN